ncbi:zinc finger MYM-type protein 1-like [Centruroides vittatus]|uniref:zinc finger MYM-type protein 1-like n=1 Tax=Centruroides vittatus TaxID=120091 RepID=UPI00351010EC
MLSSCRGQCYDGSANMSSVKSDIVAQVSTEEKSATFTHCYEYSLDLIVSDAIRTLSVMSDAMDIVHKISKLVEYSQRCEALFRNIKAALTSGTPVFRVMCLIRWTAGANLLSCIVDNYAMFLELCPECRKIMKDSETKTRIIGVEHEMNILEFLFDLLLAERILKHSDNLSKTVQQKKMSATEGEKVSFMTIKTLRSLRGVF